MTDAPVEHDVDDHDTDGDDDDVSPTARAVIEHVVAALVSDPSAIEIDLGEHRGRTSYDVRVGPGDMGRVIGRRGRVAQSIRTVARAAAARDGAEIDVEFID